MASASSNWNDIPDGLFDASRRGSWRSNRSRASQSPQILPQAANGPPSRLFLNALPPRRKSSQTVQGERRPLSERTVYEPAAVGGLFEMRPIADRSAMALHPLREVATRVGREVEEFAASVDDWKKSLDREEVSPAEAAIRLVGKYKRVAAENVHALHKTHGLAFKRKLTTKLHSLYDSNPAGKYQGKAKLDDLMTLDPPNSTSHSSVDDLEYWQNELNTWTLYESLLQVRHQKTETTHLPETSIALASDNDRFAADGDTWLQFLGQDKKAQEHLIVLKWLEQTAERTGSDLQVITDRLEDMSGKGPGLWVRGWLNTRECVKQEKRLRMMDVPLDGDIPKILSRGEPSKSVVPQLDPDAPTRLARSLELPDEVLEHATWLACWQMLRRGYDMDAIREWCHEHYDYTKMHMLGASAEGESKVSRDLIAKSRWAWRIACLQAARKGGLNDYERAVFGLLSGDETSLRSVSHSWEDHMFGMMNQLLVHGYQHYLLDHHPQLISGPKNYALVTDDAITAGLKSGVTVEGFIDGLQKRDASLLQGEQQPLQIIQSTLIINNVASLACSQGLDIARKARGNVGEGLEQLIPEQLLDALSSQRSDDNIARGHDATRVLAHILMIERTLDLQIEDQVSEEAADLVVIAYINFLLLAGKMMMIPVYIAHLPRYKAPKVVARILQVITAPDERRNFANLVVADGVDLLSALKFQYHLALANGPFGVDEGRTIVVPRLLEATSDPSWPGYRIAQRSGDPITPEEDALIQACEWFKYIGGCWVQTFTILESTMQRFLMEGRLAPAIDLAFRMASDSVSMAKTSSTFDKTVDLFTDVEFVESLEAAEAMKAQGKGYHDLTQLVAVLVTCWNFREAIDRRVTTATMSKTEINEHQRLISGSLERAKSLVDSSLLDITFMQPALPDCEVEFGEMGKERLEVLRQTYLPEALLAYISVLYRAGREEGLRDCVELAKSVAEREDLQQCFLATRRMRELVTAVAQCNQKMLQLQEEEKGRRKRRTNRRMSMTAGAGWHMQR